VIRPSRKEASFSGVKEAAIVNVASVEMVMFVVFERTSLFRDPAPSVSLTFLTPNVACKRLLD